MLIAIKQDNGHVRVYEADAVTASERGWEPRYKRYVPGASLGEMGPCRQRAAMVHVRGGASRSLNTARIVPEAIDMQVRELGRQIEELRKQRQHLLDGEFLTFPLLQVEQVERSHWPVVYPTRAEAEAHGKGR